MNIKEYAVLMANRFDKGDEKWVKYYEKKTLCVKTLPNGDVIAFDKPSVETRFCYSFDEVGYPESIDDSNHMCHEVSSDYDVFLGENLKWLKRDLENLEKMYHPIYLNRLDGVENVVRYSGYQNGANGWLARPDDIEVIKSGIQEQIDYLTKRCAAYWKRYGGSKLHTWTYSIND
ncbi:MAG: hypothetical protein J6W29_03370 [Neisseriaceae bacterium]|nr:hypothetical protein [Neisseriaceae bacterium]